MNRGTRKSLLFGIVTLMFFAAQNSTAAGTKVSAADIEAALGSEGYKNITVTVIDPGSVKIQGDVSLLYDRDRIFEIVSKFPAVREISNEVDVSTEELPDNIIKANIENELQYIYTIKNPDEINVNVSEGDVHLTGTVDYYREKLMAETVVSWQQGVLGCVNDIKVIPPNKLYTDENIQKMVNEVLNNRYSIEKNVKVSVSGGIITLTGPVSSLWAKDEIEKDIHRLVGVNKIKNDLVVM